MMTSTRSCKCIKHLKFCMIQRELTAPQTSRKPTTTAKFCFLILVLRSMNDIKL